MAEVYTQLRSRKQISSSTASATSILASVRLVHGYALNPHRFIMNIAIKDQKVSCKYSKPSSLAVIYDEVCEK